MCPYSIGNIGNQQNSSTAHGSLPSASALWNSCPLLSELICTGCFWAALVSVFLAGCTRVSYFTLFISESVDPDFLFLISMLTSVWCDCRHSGKSRSSKVLVNFHVIPLACPFIVLSITSSSSIKNISGDSRQPCLTPEAVENGSVIA